MRKTILLLISSLSGIIAICSVFLYYGIGLSAGRNLYLVTGIILLILIVSAVFYLKRLIEQLKGIPVDDEMSVMINRKAAFDSLSYQLSFWVCILVFSLFSGGPVLQISIGIIGMSLIYAGFWLFYRIKGMNQ